MKKATLSTLFGMILFSVLALPPASTQASSSSSPQSSGSADTGAETKPKSDANPVTTGTEANEKALNKGLNAGTTCLDYKLDVVSLGDNDHRIFWRRDDCIRVHVANNPFLFKYSLQFNEQLIKEDDPLGAFGGKFGLNISTGNSSAPSSNHNAKDAQDKAQVSLAAPAFDEPIQSAQLQELTNPELQPLNDKVIGLVTDAKTAFVAGDLQTPQTQLEKANTLLKNEQNILEQAKGSSKVLKDLQSKNQIPSVPAKDLSAVKTLQTHVHKLQNSLPASTPNTAPLSELESKVGDLDMLSKQIHDAFEAKKQMYQTFALSLPSKLMALTDATVDVTRSPDEIRQRAQKVNDDAIVAVNNLTDGHPDESGYGSETDEDRMVTFAQFAASLHDMLIQSSFSKNPKADELLDRLHKDAERVVVDACSYKAKIESDFVTIRTGLLDPLAAVLKDPLAFGYLYPYVGTKREGPWADPMAVTMTLKRSAASVFSNIATDGKSPTNTTASFTCSSDTTDLFEYGVSYVAFPDFFTDKLASSSKGSTSANPPAGAVPNLYAKNTNKPQYDAKLANEKPSPAGNGSKDSTKATPSDDTTVLIQPWIFGKPRLVLSGGVGTALLSKQEFQRSMSISGTTTETVIGLKTNTKIRTTPMLYGHAFIPWLDRRHDPDAWFATFGVTANSDNKGTDPEFLFGLSRSFVQQRFFVTAGAYLGERQKLDGGLYVGEVIPSSFTTDLPVTKSYHTGFSFGISYRFTSTKTAQDNAKQPSSGSSKKGN